MKVIIADDSKMLRERIINMLLTIPGVEIVAEAENSHEAIKYIEKLKPDVLILDIRMPGGNGFEMLKSIQQKKLSMIKILFTNYPLDQYKEKCFELGADYFFDKSTEFEKVKEVICNLINKSEG
ncbi:MAG: response regulator transcription factor [Bacteroidales bacterium]|nr:response regulator transcription factor [Bacteroidales bacterium]